MVFETLERVNASFVSEQLKHREGDLIWKIQLKGGQALYLYLLLEFQSADDRRMPLRMLQYVIFLYEHLLREKQISLEQGLPPVLPVVLYNGDKRWQTPTSVEQLIRYPAFLSPWQPKMEYLLLDEGALDKRKLSEQELFIAAIFELDAPGPVEDVVSVAQRLSALWRKHPLAPELAEAIKDWFYDALLAQGVDKEQIRHLLEGEVSMFGEKFVRWQEQTFQKGMELGLVKGREEGVEKGIKLGIAKGREEGMELGVEKGMELGAEKALREAAINLYRNGLEPDFIASTLSVPLEKIKQWIKGTAH